MTEPGAPRRSALVTGGSRGIGRATVLEAAARGYDVLFTYRDEAAADEVRTAAGGTDRRVEGVAVALDDPDSVADLARRAAEWPGLDLLVNNAGVIRGADLESTSVDDWETSLRVNLTAPFLLIKGLHRVLAANRGSVVNVSSTGGLSGSSVGAGYGASKAGLLGLTMTLAKELAPDVRVNALAPGNTATDMYDSAPDDVRAQWESNTPLGRAADPSEMARAILDISEWTFATGHTFVLDGGSVMR
ncbi:SDR family oxidoreductase [Cnuibacter physcomitrellae]|uniref:SDR family NAD(P)-dependent oxidoreductase n=1 Tax=Cnuibacter physcomitrellae TaxID=1619308 RepID=UPI002175E08D|nr:SDR family oxidoreductase [Cnuibacter physcomitrellae]MCS5498221.1 SDR family oxidoreductase [Cnuibacter physcomitrellae]